MSQPSAELQQLVAESDTGGRKVAGFAGALVFWVAVAWSLFQLWFASPLSFSLGVGILNDTEARSLHLAIGLFLGFLCYPAFLRASRSRIPWYDWILAVASIACGAYVTVELDGLLFRAGAQWTTLDVVVGCVGTFLVLEFGRRTSGLAMVIIAGVFLLYTFVGQWLPGVLQHRGYSFGQVFTFMYSEYGMFGVTTQVSSSYIILFVCFAAFLQVSKVGEYINDLSNALFGWARGGPAKACVASGALFGTISGSAVANVVASGMVTIPMMRKVGYDRPTAGAIGIVLQRERVVGRPGGNGRLSAERRAAGPPQTGAVLEIREKIGAAAVDSQGNGVGGAPLVGGAGVEESDQGVAAALRNVQDARCGK